MGIDPFALENTGNIQSKLEYISYQKLSCIIYRYNIYIDIIYIYKLYINIYYMYYVYRCM